MITVFVVKATEGVGILSRNEPPIGCQRCGYYTLAKTSGKIFNYFKGMLRDVSPITLFHLFLVALDGEF